MNPKSTALLVVVALSLGGFLFLRPSLPEPGWTDRAFPQLAPTDITEIILHREGSETIELARAGFRPGQPGRWLLTRPVRDRADPLAVNRLLEMITGLPGRGAKVSASAPELGLDTPRTRLQFRTRKGQEQVAFGREDPFGKAVYAQIGSEKTILLVDRSEFLALEVSLDELREHTVAPIPVHLVRSIRVTKNPTADDPGATYRLDRGDAKSDWRVADPVTDPADPSSVLRLLGGLRTMRAVSFQSIDGPASRFLSPPRWVVEVELEENLRIGPIEIGEKTEKPAAQVVRIEGRETLLVLDPQTAFQPPSLGELRSRRLLQFSPTETARIVFHRPDGSHWTLHRTGSKWEILAQTTDGDHLRHPADPDQVKVLLEALIHARIAKFVADGVSDPPPARFDLTPARVTVQISQRDPASGLIALFIGSPVAGTPGQVHAQVSNRPGSVLAIATKLAEHLIGKNRQEWTPYLQR